MSTLKKVVAAIAVLFALTSTASAQVVVSNFRFGKPADAQEIAKYFSIPPDGRGLPPGKGTGKAGAQLFADNCAACHGDKLQGIPTVGIGGDKLIGGRGSLATKTPVKTVESYWPYSTTLFDYIKRAMPFNAPGSLGNDDVYSLAAYILSEAKIIKPTDEMNAQSLPKVQMPNKDGFIPDARPELDLYH